MLCATFDDGAPRVVLFNFLSPRFQQVTLFEVTRHNIISNDASVHQQRTCNQQEQTQEDASVSNQWTSLRDVQENEGDVVGESMRSLAVWPSCLSLYDASAP